MHSAESRDYNRLMAKILHFNLSDILKIISQEDLSYLLYKTYILLTYHMRNKGMIN